MVQDYTNNAINLKTNAVSDLVRNGISFSEANIEVNILLEFVFGLSKKDLILFPDKALPDNKIDEFNSLLKKRIDEKIPVQYLTHKAYFMNFEFYVDENVLIPRPETELLVDECLKIMKEQNISKIIDIGTGSGCIACSIAKLADNVDITACDISDRALAVAEKNAANLGIKDKIKFVKSNILENIDEKFNLIISNPPYIPKTELENLQIEVSKFEQHLALFADDKEGIHFYKEIIEQSSLKLENNGYIAFELGISQFESVKKLFEQAGFIDINIIKDYSGIERVITAKKFK